MKKQLKVLVVEDEVFTARNLCQELERNNVIPLGPVSLAEKAVEIALAENPDLILMDVRLAGEMDGIEAARQIKKEFYIPIIFMTAYATDYVIEQAKDVNCLYFFEKPITINNLLPVIEQLKQLQNN